MTSLKFFRVFVALLIPAGAFFLLPGCGGGGEGEGDGGVRPTSLNGVTLNFQGARLTFTTSTPNATSGGTEVGGIYYEQLSEAPVTFSPNDASGLDPAKLKWPVDLGGNTRYEYTPIDGSTGRLLIYADNYEPNTIFQDIDTFDSIVLTFTASGGIVTGIEAVMTVSLTGEFTTGRFVSNFNPTAKVGGLSSNPRPLPAGWNGINEGPGFIAVSSFNGKVLTLDEDGGDVQIQLGTFVASGGVVKNINSSKESGVVAVLVTSNISNPGSETTELYEADYTATQTYGTENVDMKLSYRSGTTPTLPDDETIVLSFLGGEKISDRLSSVEVRTGTYTKGNTFGSFIMDMR